MEINKRNLLTKIKNQERLHLSSMIIRQNQQMLKTQSLITSSKSLKFFQILIKSKNERRQLRRLPRKNHKSFKTSYKKRSLKRRFYLNKNLKQKDQILTTTERRTDRNPKTKRNRFIRLKFDLILKGNETFELTQLRKVQIIVLKITNLILIKDQSLTTFYQTLKSLLKTFPS